MYNPSLTLEVFPTIGISIIQLGMSKNEVRTLMDLTFKEFKKLQGNSFKTDIYLNDSVQVFYDLNDKVNFIEVSYNPETFNLVYKDINLFETEAKKLIQLLSEETIYIPDHPEIPYGFLFQEYKLILWRPRAEDDYTEDENEDEFRKGKYFMIIGIGDKNYLFN